MAMENSNIRADMIEANEFGELSQRYSVYGVPKTIINEIKEVEGSLPEGTFLKHVLDALKPAEQ